MELEAVGQMTFQVFRQAKPLVLAVVFLLFFLGTVAQAGRTPTTFKVKIEATELDKKLLLERLNANGKDDEIVGRHLMKFELADQDCDYRIVFAIEQRPYGVGYGSMNSSMASVDVFDKTNVELFKFNRQGRATDKGAANAAAIEILKRLIQLQ
jgi:hypothetical protein